MNDTLRPPADRDLTPRRANRMRAQLMNQIRPRRTHRPARRLGLVAAGAAAVIAAAGVPVLLDQTRNGAPPSASAASPTPKRGQVMVPSTGGPLDRTLASITEECLYMLTKPIFNGGDKYDSGKLPFNADDVVVAAQHNGVVAAVFLTDQGYYSCHTEHEKANPTRADYDLAGGSVSYGSWRDADDPKWKYVEKWLPGHVQVFAAASDDGSSDVFRDDNGDGVNDDTTPPDEGVIVVQGRVSAQVDRLELAFSGGRTVPVNLNGGGFGLVTSNSQERPTADLIAYDMSGKEIYRVLAFAADRKVIPGCFVDPAGEVVYLPESAYRPQGAKAGSVAGTTAPTSTPAVDPKNCQPAVPWTR